MVHDLRVWDGRYISLVTYRRDGIGTACPVWCARRGSRLVFRTFARTVKARRLGRDERVALAPCERDGTPTGPYVHGLAVRLTGPAAWRAGGQLTRRQGPVKPLSDLYYRFTLGRIVTYAVDLASCRDDADAVVAR